MSNAFQPKDCPVPEIPEVNPDDYGLESCHVPEPPDFPVPEEFQINTPGPQGPSGPAGPAGPEGPQGPEGDCDCAPCDSAAGDPQVPELILGVHFVEAVPVIICVPVGHCDEEESPGG